MPSTSQPLPGGTESLAVALGANLGDPVATLVAVRPLLEALLRPLAQPRARIRWSPLFRTEPVGGPAGQPDYLNAVVLLERLRPEPDPLALLAALQELERRFGRERRERWGPRLLDLDLLWCGSIRLEQPGLSLPHPRLLERSFVLAPLLAIDPNLVPPGQPDDAARPVSSLLEALLPRLSEALPQQLAPQMHWPE